MIFDFDLTDAPERRTSVYNAPGNINSSLIVSAPSGRFYHYINPKKRAEHAYLYIADGPSGCRGKRVPRGGAFLFFILFMQHTQHTLLFFVQSYKSKKFLKNLLTRTRKYDII